MAHVIVGDRVEMIGVMPNDPGPIPVGATGTVREVLNPGTVHEQIDVAWDAARSLFLLPGDPFRVVPTA